MQNRFDPRKGRFYRPELETGWQRFSSNAAVRIVAAAILIASVAILVIAALLRFG